MKSKYSRINYESDTLSDYLKKQLTSYFKHDFSDNQLGNYFHSQHPTNIYHVWVTFFVRPP